jgi:MFS family permease
MLAAQGGMLVLSRRPRGLDLSRPRHAGDPARATFLLGCGGALYGPAWQSSVREQVPRADLPAAVTLNSAGFNLARAVGPALGGVLVATAGPAAAFGVNAVSYLALIGVLSFWKRPRPSRPAARSPRRRHAVGPALRPAVPRASVVLVRARGLRALGGRLWALMPLVARDLLGGAP